MANLAAHDVERARKFYEQTLGLPVVHADEGAVIFRCGENSYFGVYPSTFAGTAQNTVLSWITEDLDGDMADLRARGIVFEEYDFPGLKTVNGVADMGGERGCWFKDTEGNIVGLFEYAGELPF
jgi:catechol 2,3-dioxygenase-like lactoylglutathione lyase family enzyme